MIDRYLVRYFLAVVDQGSFSRAAEQCRVSQPTLSVGIAKLETILGQPLFNRSNRRVELTVAGARFAPHARGVENEFALGERAVREEVGGRLTRIGIATSLPAARIGVALATAIRESPDERLELAEGRMHELATMLERGRLDVIVGPIAPDRGETLFIEPYLMAMSTRHPLARLAQVTTEQLAAEPMIVRRHCEALNHISRFFTSRGIRPFMAARTHNDERAVALVDAGLGITVMPQCFSSPRLAMPVVAGLGLTRAIGFVTDPASRHRVAASPAFASFREALRLTLHIDVLAAADAPASSCTGQAN